MVIFKYTKLNKSFVSLVKHIEIADCPFIVHLDSESSRRFIIFLAYFPELNFGIIAFEILE